MGCPKLHPSRTFRRQPRPSNKFDAKHIGRRLLSQGVHPLAFEAPQRLVAGQPATHPTNAFCGGCASGGSRRGRGRDACPAEAKPLLRRHTEAGKPLEENRTNVGNRKEAGFKQTHRI
eukprot:GHVT01078904.1.p1 GENE.GHVT01078904.1~~GHVT01078904.1.p1  ORF type:complete len:118 (+),score=19.05 GHVT01078904.1:137-490(+)